MIRWRAGLRLDAGRKLVGPGEDHMSDRVEADGQWTSGQVDGGYLEA